MKTILLTICLIVSSYSIDFHQETKKQRQGVEAKFTKLADEVPSKQKNPKSKFENTLLGIHRNIRYLNIQEKNINNFSRIGFEEGTFQQKVDHFNETNSNFFEQKYFKNSRWAKPGGPNFLMIGGEMPIWPELVLAENYSFLVVAQKYGATVYLLEHRFYGDSLVENNTDLTKLTSLQMLYDLAEFIKAVNLKTETSNPWITYGGSYSGSLSAWMRELFPELIIGAVASSAPVLAKTDFYEYSMVTEQLFRSYSTECAEKIRNGFETLGQKFLSKEGRQEISTLFGLKPPFQEKVTDMDRQFFLGNVVMNFDLTGLDTDGIPSMCKIFENDSNTPIENLAESSHSILSPKKSSKSLYTEINNNYTHYINQMKNDTGRLWYWQSCNEFGYFATTDTGNSIFGLSSIGYQVQECRDLFGENFTRSAIDEFVAQTNERYGGNTNYKGTNVVFINGNHDQWHVLSLYDSDEPSVVSYLINGSSHCEDMLPAKETDVPGLKIARDVIDKNIGIWLNDAANITIFS